MKLAKRATPQPLPKEKESVYRNDLEEDEWPNKKNKKTDKHVINAASETCPYVKAHEDNKFDCLLQEQDALNLNNNWHTFKSSRSECEKSCQ